MLEVYASYFVSYFLKSIGRNIENIRNVILFGSVARGEAGKDSDVDIFVEVKKKNKTFEKETGKIAEDFSKSREGLLFRANNIDNKINVIVGKLDEWKNLKKNIESTGILLYGKHNFGGGGDRKYAIIFWNAIKKNRGAFLNKLYGFNAGGKKYIGLVENFGGRKLGKSSIMVPIEYREDIVQLLKKYGVNAKIVEVYA